MPIYSEGFALLVAKLRYRRKAHYDQADLEPSQQKSPAQSKHSTVDSQKQSTVSSVTVSAELHYTDTGYEHHQRTPPTDELTTILQLNVVQHNKFTIKRTKICHIPTSWHVEMLGSGIAIWQICCRIFVSSSIGGVRCWCCTTCPYSRCPCSGFNKHSNKVF